MYEQLYTLPGLRASYLSLQFGEIVGYCPLCDKGVVDEGTWYQYITSLDVFELAQFLSDYRCGNCMRRGNNYFPGDVETWLLSKKKP